MTNGNVNVLGEPLALCSASPTTGFYRNGCCETGAEDRGAHVVCAIMSEDFLAFSKSQRNNLSSAAPAFGFPGLKPGDRWCLCALRWKEALEAGRPPRIVLGATHRRALDHIELADLKRYAIDLS